MVTKELLPRSGGPRGGQRYGRPKHAGVTRQHVNMLIASQRAQGRRIRHWVRTLPNLELVAEQETLVVAGVRSGIFPGDPVRATMETIEVCGEPRSHRSSWSTRLNDRA